jgi:hypothetical protein
VKESAATAELRLLAELPGPWTVRFATNWSGPAEVQFDSLVSWPDRVEPGIRYYSGSATYEQAFALTDAEARAKHARLYLDLGDARELAAVCVNGKNCGITWCPPFRVDITAAVKPGQNQLEIEVVNFWPNRIIGDATVPAAQRRTRTNIRKLTAQTPLMPSGLLGPVRILREEIVKP